MKVIDGTSDIFANKLEKFNGKEVDFFKLSNFYALDTVSG
jgi:hypothetical protein